MGTMKLFLMVLTLFSAATNLSTARPTIDRITGEQQDEDHQEHLQQQTPADVRNPPDPVEGISTVESAEDNDEDLSSHKIGTEQTKRKVIARDTFLRLEPTNPRRTPTAARIAQQQLRSGDERHRAEAEEDPTTTVGRPLRDGETVLTLTSAADFLNEGRAAATAANNCRGDLFKHKVRVAGCRPKTLYRRFCHGSCTSFYIPRLRSKKLKATFQSCAACVPVETDLIQVRLDCPDREGGELYQTVVRVKRCACRNIMLEGGEEEDEKGGRKGEEEDERGGRKEEREDERGGRKEEREDERGGRKEEKEDERGGRKEEGEDERGGRKEEGEDERGGRKEEEDERGVKKEEKEDARGGRKEEKEDGRGVKKEEEEELTIRTSGEADETVINGDSL